MPRLSQVRRWVVLVALGVSVAAMATLHLVQPELHPLEQPVSFYIHGAQGWLLAVALGAFGFASLALARALQDEQPCRPKRYLALAGATLLLTAIIRSDRWFPWERPPTFPGLVHATAAMIAPVLLLVPMVLFAPQPDTRMRRALSWSVRLYIAAVIGSAVSLAIGLLRDGPPPWIGLLERALAFAAVGWMSAFTWQAQESGCATRNDAEPPLA